ncbi:MAG: c-type cytochrome [Gammaproteobacteria bacterium]|nr:c-type cytochrome [Gammaproteobacteria bacterium]
MRFAPVLAAAALFAAPTLALAEAATLYKTECAKCHGDDGRSDTPAGKAMKAPDLTRAAFKDMDDGALAKAILENPKHTALAGKISAEDAAALAAFVKSL